MLLDASGKDPTGNLVKTKFRFFDIAKISFSWKSKDSLDEGKTWIETASLLASRVSQCIAYPPLLPGPMTMNRRALPIAAMPLPTATAMRMPCLISLALCLATLSLSCRAAPPREASVESRMASCDSATARSAVAEILRDPKTLLEPLTLFQAALAQREAGHIEDAAFLFLAARLRTSRQILFEKGDRPQLLTIMVMSVGPLVIPVLEADANLARRVVRRTIAWDRVTPDPFRDRPEAKSGEIGKKMAEIDAGLARLPDQIADNPERVAQAREQNKESELQIKAMYTQRCGPGTLDLLDAEAATERIQSQAQLLAAAHPLVLQQAGGAVKSVNVGSYNQGATRLPIRLTVSVTPLSEKPFYAEVDVVTTITPDRKLGPVKLSLACLTSFSIGYRDTSWKDVCLGDPNAIKPVDGQGTDFSRFDIDANGKSLENPPQSPFCGFPDLKLPADFSVFAAGAYSPGRKLSFQIDQSGYEVAQVDVAVNSPGKPVVLMLGAYEPTIWNLGWSKETKILAVLVGGYHRQVVTGLDKSIPVVVSTYDNKGACGPFHVDVDVNFDKLASLNPMSQRVFGRPIDKAYPAAKGKVHVGTPLAAGASLIRSADVKPESFFDKTAPIAGPAGLADAVRRGTLRKATPADARAWVEAVRQSSGRADVLPVAGQVVPSPSEPEIYNGYVVLKPFTYPSGLYGGHLGTFLVPKGVPTPGGNPGHSSVYDFNNLNCQGALCSAR